MTAVSMVGIGKLGAPIAAAMASCGCDVICVDANPRSIELLNAGFAPVQEPSLQETITTNRSRIRGTMDYTDAIHNSDITFIFVPTPSDEHGAFTIQFAAQAFRDIGRALMSKDAYHLVVLGSTVLPGSTRFGLLPIIEQASGKLAGRDFGLCYNPEFVALGSVIHDFLNPDLVMIGEYDERSGAELQRWWSESLNKTPNIRRMSLENAELSKIAVNNYVTVKITFANMLAELCQEIPGGDVDAVTGALGLDCRIGSRFFKGGLGYGGPCFPRDTVAMGFLSRLLHTPFALVDAVEEFNGGMPGRILAKISPYLTADTDVAILGLSYKPMTPEITESQSIELAMAAIDAGCHVRAYDPLAGPRARAVYGHKLKVVDTLDACLENAGLVMITTADPAFRNLVAADFEQPDKIVTVVDFWRLLSPELANHPGIRYIAFGVSSGPGERTRSLADYWAASASEVKE
jgi:UDPglucose 6-dehydrogenase